MMKLKEMVEVLKVDGFEGLLDCHVILEHKLKMLANQWLVDLRKEADKYKTLLKMDLSCMESDIIITEEDWEDNNFRQLMKTFGKIDFIKEFILEENK